MKRLFQASVSATLALTIMAPSVFASSVVPLQGPHRGTTSDTPIQQAIKQIQNGNVENAVVLPSDTQFPNTSTAISPDTYIGGGSSWSLADKNYFNCDNDNAWYTSSVAAPSGSLKFDAEAYTADGSRQEQYNVSVCVMNGTSVGNQVGPVVQFTSGMNYTNYIKSEYIFSGLNPSLHYCLAIWASPGDAVKGTYWVYQ